MDVHARGSVVAIPLVDRERRVVHRECVDIVALAKTRHGEAGVVQREVALVEPGAGLGTHVYRAVGEGGRPRVEVGGALVVSLEGEGAAAAALDGAGDVETPRTVSASIPGELVVAVAQRGTCLHGERDARVALEGDGLPGGGEGATGDGEEVAGASEGDALTDGQVADRVGAGRVDGATVLHELEGLVEGLHRVGGVRAGLGVIAGRGQPHLGEGGASLRCTSGSLGGLCRRRGLL